MLGELNLESHRTELQRHGTSWGDLSPQDSGKHFGFVVGPGAADQAWDGQLRKLQKSLEGWPWAVMGLPFAVPVWNSYLLLTFLYVAQLCCPPERVSRKVDSLSRKTCRTPYNLSAPQELHHLQRGLVFNIEFKEYALAAKAAQLRVAPGLHPQPRTERLRALARASAARTRRYAARIE